MDCQENEYWDQWGQCATCQLCGPGQELSKDCDYGEGGDAYCTSCPPCRYKSSWGHHRCQTCITCAVINCIQKANCTTTYNAVCGDCLPRCLPVELNEGKCTHSAPSEGHTCCNDESLLMVFTLVFLGLFFFYCKQFFNRHCQHVAGGSLQFEADKASEEESLFTMPPGQETSPKSPLGESIFESQPLNPILDDDCSSTCGFPTQESFTMASCASESHSHWLHIPIECTELDLQMFSSSPSCTGSETLGGNTAENSEDRLEFNMPFEVPSD